MPRIRTVKPEFYSDERLASELTRDQRLLYQALWCYADDEGRFQPNRRAILGFAFQWDDDLTEEWVSDSLRLLSATGRVVIYSVGGERFAQLTKMAQHQRINRPTPSRFPSMDTEGATIYDPHASLSEPSVSPHARNREQGTGNREQGTGSTRQATLVDAPPSPGSHPWIEGTIFEPMPPGKSETWPQWVERMKKSAPDLTDQEARAKILDLEEWWIESPGKVRGRKTAGRTLRSPLIEENARKLEGEVLDMAISKRAAKLGIGSKGRSSKASTGVDKTSDEYRKRYDPTWWDE